MSNSSQQKPIFAGVLQRAFSKAIRMGKSYEDASVWINDAIEETLKSNEEENKKKMKQFIYGKKYEPSFYVDSIRAIQSELSYYEEEDYGKVKKVNSSVIYIDKFINQVKNKFNKDVIELPEKTQIEKYLSYYFDLCKVLFSDSSLLYADMIDANGNLQTYCAYLSSAPFGVTHNIYSPYCAESLLTLYRSFENIINLSDFTEIDDFVKEMIAAVYSTKAFRNFRHFMIRDDKSVLISCENTHNFVEKKRHNLSSFELIKPIRTFGKIKRYLKLLDKEDVCTVKFIGAVYISPEESHRPDPNTFGSDGKLNKYSYEMLELCQWLQANSDTKERKYKFNIYINRRSMPECFLREGEKENDFCDQFSLYQEKILISFYYCDYDLLSSKDELDNNILKDDGLVLFLDCPFLYDNLCVVNDNISINDYFRYLPEQYSVDDCSLSRLGNIQSIQNQLNMLQLDRCEKTGHFERRLRDKMLRHIATIINKKQTEGSRCKKEVFVFISSQSSISVSEYSRLYQVRMEKYNGKEICLLHFGGKEGQDLTNSKDDIACDNKRIVFNFWDIIVNTDLSLVTIIKEYFNIGDLCTAECASNVVIELQWEYGNYMFSNVTVAVNVNFGVTTTTLCRKIKKTIQSYFDTVFNNRCKLESAIINCMRESFFNVFYSKIINVCQALAYQRLREHLVLGKKIKINIADYKIEHGSYDESEYSVSTKKKAYVDVITNLSRDFPSETLSDILTYRMEQIGLSSMKVYQEIIDACETIQYCSCNLYTNAKKMKNK